MVGALRRILGTLPTLREHSLKGIYIDCKQLA
jgi:hypothetical protein